MTVSVPACAAVVPSGICIPCDAEVGEDVGDRHLLPRREVDRHDGHAPDLAEPRGRPVDEVDRRRDGAVVHERHLGRVVRAGLAVDVEDDRDDRRVRAAARPPGRKAGR